MEMQREIRYNFLFATQIGAAFLLKFFASWEWLLAMYMCRGHPTGPLSVLSRSHRVTACHYDAYRNDRIDGGGGIGVTRYFIDHTIRAEQQDYEAEGVEWEHVDYFNNKVTSHFLRCVFFFSGCCLQPFVVRHKGKRCPFPVLTSKAGALCCHRTRV